MGGGGGILSVFHVHIYISVYYTLESLPAESVR